MLNINYFYFIVRLLEYLTYIKHNYIKYFKMIYNNE